MQIPIQGYLEGYNLTYTMEENTSVIANTNNIYQFRLHIENIDQTIWDSNKYHTKLISFYNNTSKILETRILSHIDDFYYANIPNSVLTVKGRLYITINFYSDDSGIVTKEMDNPIFIYPSEDQIQILEPNNNNFLRFETILESEIIEIPIEIYCREDYQKLLQVYLEGRLLSSLNDYEFDSTGTKIIVKTTYNIGQEVILILIIPYDYNAEGRVADYSAVAGKLQNNLIIGQTTYDGSSTVSLLDSPDFPKSIIYNKDQDLEKTQQKIARNNIKSNTVFTISSFEEAELLPEDGFSIGDILVTENEVYDSRIFLPPPTVDGETIISQNNEWIAAPPKKIDIIGLPKPEDSKVNDIVQFNGKEWVPVNINNRLLIDPTKTGLNIDDSKSYVNALHKKNGTYQWNAVEARSLFTPTFKVLTLSANTTIKTEDEQGNIIDKNLEYWTKVDDSGTTYYEQTINNITDITSNSVLLATPDAYSYLSWANNSVHLASKEALTLVFRAYSLPSVDILVNVVYFGEKTPNNTEYFDENE